MFTENSLLKSKSLPTRLFLKWFNSPFLIKYLYVSDIQHSVKDARGRVGEWAWEILHFSLSLMNRLNVNNIVTCTSLLWVLIPPETVYFFTRGSYPASSRNVCSSTQVPARAWNNTRRGTPEPSSISEKWKTAVWP